MFVVEVGTPSEVDITGEDVEVDGKVFVGAPSDSGITDVCVGREGSCIVGVLS